MNTITNIWSHRRNRIVAVVVGAGIAGAAVMGGAVATANAATPAAAVVPAAATTPAPGTVKADAVHLRAAIKGIRALPAAQRPAAFLQLKTDVLAGKYGAVAKRDLAAIDAIVASDPAGLRNALLRLAAVHPHRAATGSTRTPAPTTQPTPSASS